MRARIIIRPLLPVSLLFLVAASALLFMHEPGRSVALGGAEGNNASVAGTRAAASSDGRYVAFLSLASNLVPDDTNDVVDVFVHDDTTGETTRVSVDSAGNQADSDSWQVAMSADGRYVAFTSFASNLISGGTNGQQVFLHDRDTGETSLVSVDNAGNQGNGASGNVANGPAISGDGRYVAFFSLASNLVPDDTNGTGDVFVHDRDTGETTRMSVDSAGNQANGMSQHAAISDDGRYVAFASDASNLVSGDTNSTRDAFVHDRTTGETVRVSVDSAGNEANGASSYPAISGDDGHVAFVSAATNLVAGDTNGYSDVFVHDMESGETERVSVDDAGNEANGVSGQSPALSVDGCFVAFRSAASNLVPGDNNAHLDIFVHDRNTGATTRVSVDSAGTQGNGESAGWGLEGPAISGDGRYVTFISQASNLVPADSNNYCDTDFDGDYTDNCPDAFVHDRQTAETTRVSVASVGVGPDLIVEDMYDNQNFDCTKPMGLVVVVRNVGTQSAGPSTTHVSTGGQAVSVYTPGLAPGESADVVAQIFGGDSTAVADWDNVVSEGDETNNSLTKWVQTTSLATCTPTPTPTATPTNTSTPTPVETFTQVSAGGDHSCGLRTDGTLACWGHNEYGQAAPPAGTFNQVSAGGNHSCGVRTDSTLACWGQNEAGKATPPTGTFTQVSAGGRHTCGLRTDGTVACWGFNLFGEATPPAGTFSQVSAGDYHTCALKTDSTLACWGDNSDGQTAPPADTFNQVSAGSGHTCGFKTDGTLVCWGDDTFGQATPPTDAFIQADAGNYHTCGVRADGTVACWGINTHGQVAPLPPGTFSQVSAGAENTCGVKTDGTVACWGQNFEPTPTPTPGSPTPTPTPRPPTQTPTATNTPAPGEAPDLVVNNIYSGQDFYNSCYLPPVVEVVIENVGTYPAAPSQVEVSTSGKTGYGNVSALSPGQFANVDVYIQDATSGDFTATADVYDVVDESDESNNSLTKWVDLATQGFLCTPTLTPSPTGTATPTPTPTSSPTPTDVDGDGVPDSIDNCPDVSNPDQLNTDAKPIDNGPGITGGDLSVPNSDILGDACDPDIDNDYMLNTGTNQTLNIRGEDVGCGSGPTNPNVMDTDGDTVVDGYECIGIYHSDPNDPLSKPPTAPPYDSDRDGVPDSVEALFGSDPHNKDTDGDGIPDSLEVKGWGTSPALKDTNFNGCDDNIEIADVDGNYRVNTSDLLWVAYGVGGQFAYNADLDVTKDGRINTADLLLVALQLTKSCR